MRRITLLPLACAAILIAGCAVTPPTATTPAASPTLTTPATTAVASPSVTATTPTPSPEVTVSPTQAANAIPLTASGIGSQKFGAAEASVEGFMTSRMGKPDDSYSGPVCEVNDATPYGRQISYGATYLFFESAPKKGKTAPRTFTSWVVGLDEELKAPIALPAGYPGHPTYAELQQQFSKGKLTQIALGEGGFWVFTTPDGFWYRGEDDVAPEQLGAGPQQTCE